MPAARVLASADSASAIRAVDARLAAGGLRAGRRASRANTWARGERVPTANPGLPHAVRLDLDSGTPGLLRVPAFDRIPWIRAGFSTRENGLTTAYVEDLTSNRQTARPPAPPELNLGWTAHDTEASVAANRGRFVGWVTRGHPLPLVTTRQFHSGMVRSIRTGASPLATPDGRATLRGDALITNVPGLLLGIQTADCVPILLADPRRKAVAAFHAGWRGTLARILERGVGLMRLDFGSNPKDLIAAIGPAIGPCCFAVGDEVRHQFESQFAYAPQLFFEVYDSDPIRDKYPMLFLTQRAPGHSSLGPQLHLDLFEANRRQLLDAGLRAGNITVSGECTACTRLASGRRKYFSHRAEHGFTGRMMSVIGIKARDEA